jgi:hypothetical protein
MKVEVIWLGAPPEQVVPLVRSCVSSKSSRRREGHSRRQRWCQRKLSVSDAALRQVGAQGFDRCVTWDMEDLDFMHKLPCGSGLLWVRHRELTSGSRRMRTFHLPPAIHNERQDRRSWRTTRSSRHSRIHLIHLVACHRRSHDPRPLDVEGFGVSMSSQSPLSMARLASARNHKRRLRQAAHQSA